MIVDVARLPIRITLEVLTKVNNDLARKEIERFTEQHNAHAVQKKAIGELSPSLLKEFEVMSEPARASEPGKGKRIDMYR